VTPVCNVRQDVPPQVSKTSSAGRFERSSPPARRTALEFQRARSAAMNSPHATSVATVRTWFQNVHCFK
jgi:hypothetical protein